MTKTELKREMALAIDEFIYEVAKEVGHFVQGVWLFRLDDHNSQSVELSGSTSKDLAICGAIARNNKLKFDPSFSIIAANSIAGSVVKSIPKDEKDRITKEVNSVSTTNREAVERVLNDPRVNARTAYMFLGYSPDAGYVLATQYYTRDSDDSVELEGKLLFRTAKIHQELVEFSIKAMEPLNPWREPDAADQAILDKTELSTANAAGVVADRLTMKTLFPPAAKQLL